MCSRPTSIERHRTDPLDLPGRKDQQDLLDHKAPKGCRDRRVHQAVMGPQARLDPKDLRGPKAHQDCRGRPGYRAAMAPLVRLDRKEL